MIRQFLLNCDLRAGRHVPLKLPAYIREQYLKDGQGIYSREEWSHARRNGYRGAGVNSSELDTDDRYLTRVFSSHVRNLHAALRLLETFRFESYDSVLELGCGEMIQAFAIKCAHPQLRYMATDFDPFVVEKCSRLPVLGQIEKDVVDASQLSVEQIAGFSLVVAWEMIYALDDEKLLTVLRACRGANVPLLACTTQMIGPAQYIFRKMKNLWRRLEGVRVKGAGAAEPLRMHGWNPSPAYYARLARHAGLELVRIWHPPALLRGGDDFSYLLFAPDRTGSSPK